MSLFSHYQTKVYQISQLFLLWMVATLLAVAILLMLSLQQWRTQ